jgi:hypothetical protein
LEKCFKMLLLWNHLNNWNQTVQEWSLEGDLWNFSQSEHIIGPGSHVEYLTGTKNRNSVEDHPMNIPAKFGCNWPSGFGEDAWNVKSLQTTDNRRRTPSDDNSSPGPLVGPGELKTTNKRAKTKYKNIPNLKKISMCFRLFKRP